MDGKRRIRRLGLPGQRVSWAPGVRGSDRMGWPGVSPPRARLGWILISDAQCSHLTVPFRATSDRFERPQFLQFHSRLTCCMRSPAFSPTAGDGRELSPSGGIGENKCITP